MKKPPRTPRPKEQKIHLDDGLKIGKQPGQNEKIYIDDGASIGIPKQAKKSGK